MKAQKANDTSQKDSIESYIEKLKELEPYLNVRYEVTRSYYFKHYTEHGWIHAIRVLDYMLDIADPDALTNLELMLIIYAALLHDIGMALTKEEGEALYNDDLIRHRVTVYRKSHPSVNEEDAKRDVRTVLIRGKHGKLANDAVRDLPGYQLDTGSGVKRPLSDLFLLHDGTVQQDVKSTVGALCESHTNSVYQISQARDDSQSFIFIAGLLRIADYLDMVSSRANEYYQSIHHISEDSGTHFTVNRVVDSTIEPFCDQPCNSGCPNHYNGLCDKRKKQIHIKCNYPTDLTRDKKVKAMRMVDDYIDDLGKEIFEVNELLCQKRFDPQYHIRLLSRIKLSVTLSNPFAKGMKMKKLTVDYSAIKTLFSSSQLYKSKLCGLRELMQNSYDACKDFVERSQSNHLWTPKIIIEIDVDTDTFSLFDNGIGMNEYIIREYFLKIGKSIYNCEPNYIYDDHYRDHIGHFGLGFFAAFMLSPQVTVETRYLESQAQHVELDINSNFATLADGAQITEHGTKVTLSLSAFQDALCKEFKTDHYKGSSEFAQRVTEYIENTFLDDGIDITVFLNHKSWLKPKLQKIEIIDSLSLNERLVNIAAVAKVPRRIYPPIFFAKDANSLDVVNYEELLERLSGEKREVPYLHAGSFLVFATDGTIVEDFQTRASSGTRCKRNLSGRERMISDKLNVTLDALYTTHPTILTGEKPTQCRYATLTYLKDARNHAALCERDVPCSEHRIAMSCNDACGVAPLDDKYYMRSVLLSDLHITLPFMNFQYSFDKLIANIKTDSVYPTLPRDTLNDEYRTELGWAIGKAIADCKNTDGDQLISEMLYGDLVNNTFYRKG